MAPLDSFGNPLVVLVGPPGALVVELRLVVGHADLRRVDLDGQTLEVGGVVGGEDRGHGLAGHVVDVLVGLGGTDGRLGDGEGELDVFDIGSRAVLHNLRVAEINNGVVLTRLDDLLDNVALGVGVGDGVVLTLGEGAAVSLGDDRGLDRFAGVLDLGAVGRPCRRWRRRPLGCSE